MKDEKRDKTQREASELKEKLAMQERVAQTVCDDIMREGVDEHIKDVAREQHRLVKFPYIMLYDHIICECLLK